MQILKERMVLTSDDTASVFGEAVSIDRDWSLHALLRAVVLKYGTWKDNAELKSQTGLSKVRVTDATEAMSVLDKRHFQYAVAVVECADCIDNITEIPEGWTSELSYKGKPFPAAKYLSQFGATKLYVNYDDKRIVAYVSGRASHIWVQAFETLFCRIMTWYFPPELPEEEMTFARSIAADNLAGLTDREKREVKLAEMADLFVEYVNAASKVIDFRSMKLHAMLDGVADRARMKQVERLKNTIESIMSDIRSLTRDLGRKYTELDTEKTTLTGLELVPASEDDSMYQFFSRHAQINLLSCDEGGLRFGVDETLEFYDVDIFDRAYNNSRSFINDRNPEVVEIVKAIFGERRGVFRVNAIFDLDDFRLIRSQENESFIEDAMPNPHIYWFGCDGDNGRYYSQYAESGDWELGVEQAIAATKNLSWGDSIVCGRMLDWIDNHRNVRCVYCGDGSPIEGNPKELKLITIKEFLDTVRAKKMEERNG